MGFPWPGGLWKKYLVVTSPSAIADFNGCPRGWWFKKIARLPEVAGQKKFLFGNVFHDVVERILKDQPDHYPKGWEGELTVLEAQRIRDLITMGLEDGVLHSRSGVEVEVPVWMPVTPTVAIIGRFDIVSDVGVEDHKTVSSRRWLATSESLACDPKMLCYARMWQAYTGRSGDVKLQLNCFSKDPRDPWIEIVKTTIPAAKVEEWWSGTVIPTADHMALLARVRKADDVQKDEQGHACRSYGGCPLIDVCNKWESIPDYRNRVEKANNERKKT